MAVKKSVPGTRNDRPRHQRARDPSAHSRARINPHACVVQTRREQLRQNRPGQRLVLSQRQSGLLSGDNDNSQASTSTDQRQQERQRGSQRPNKRGRRDPDAPKRPPSNFLLFCREQLPRMRLENPDLPVTQITCRLGHVWQEMGAEDREPFNSLAAMLREKYRQDMDRYQARKRVCAGGPSHSNVEAGEGCSEQDEDGEEIWEDAPERFDQNNDSEIGDDSDSDNYEGGSEGSTPEDD